MMRLSFSVFLLCNCLTACSLGSKPIWYRDADSDGFPVKSELKKSRTQPDGYILPRADQLWDDDDTNASIHTSANETLTDNLILFLDDSHPVALQNIFGSSSVFFSKNGAKATDDSFLAKVKALNIQVWKYGEGSESQWYHIDTTGNGNGLNCNCSEAVDRKLDCNTIILGECKDLPGFDFFGDYVAAYKKMNIPKASITLNIYSPVAKYAYKSSINWSEVNFKPMFDELDYFVHQVGGVAHVQNIQLGLESKLYEDLYPEMGKSYAGEINYLLPILRKKYPGVAIVADATLLEKNNTKDVEWNDAIHDLNVDGFRQYIPWYDFYDTYGKMKAKIEEEFPITLQKFENEFPGKDMYIQQMEVKNKNPFYGTVANGLVFAEAYMKVSELNITHNNRVKVISQMNTKNLFDNKDEPHASYYFMREIGQMYGGDAQLINASFNTTSVSGIFSMAEIKNGQYQIVIMNTTAQEQMLSAIQLKTSSAHIWYNEVYGILTEDYVKNISGETFPVTIMPYSLTRILLR